MKWKQCKNGVEAMQECGGSNVRMRWKQCKNAVEVRFHGHSYNARMRGAIDVLLHSLQVNYSLPNSTYIKKIDLFLDYYKLTIYFYQTESVPKYTPEKQCNFCNGYNRG